MPDAPHPDAVVIRFRPISAERVLERAAQDARRSDGKRHHTASVWADHARRGETREQLIDRLLAVSELHGVVAENNPDYWRCSTARELTDRQFTFEKDGYPDEPEEHYSVVLGNPPETADAQRFVSAFTKERRRKQA